MVVWLLASDVGRGPPTAGFDGEWEWAADYSDVKGDYGIKMQSAGELAPSGPFSGFALMWRQCMPGGHPPLPAERLQRYAMA